MQDRPQSATSSSDGPLENLLRAGQFAITAELTAPDSADPQDVFERAELLIDACDAINATDASGANSHMSSMGICALLSRAGYTPVLQIACRDRNRIAIQGDVLGAAAMGICNILCLTGDGVQAGDQPDTKPVFDLGAVSLLQTLRTMRDDGQLLSGRKLKAPPRVFLGAAANPFAPPLDFRPLHLAAKIEAGAQFIQTQYCFDVPLLQSYMEQVRGLGLHERCFILVGVGPLASAGSARWIRSNVAGIHIPDDVIERLEGAKDQKLEGMNLCIEIIQQVREINGVSGIHIMAYRQEEMVAEIVLGAGLRDRKNHSSTQH